MTLSNEDSFYEQNGGVKNFSFQNGTVRRYFTWPMISQRISFHERPNSFRSKKKISLYHDGGTWIRQPRLQDALSSHIINKQGHVNNVFEVTTVKI